MPIIINTDGKSVAELETAKIEEWVKAAQEKLTAAGFTRDKGPWWKHPGTGWFATIDDYVMGFGSRFVALYAHRVDATGKDYMAALAMVPWYGDGFDITAAVCTLTLILGDVT